MKKLNLLRLGFLIAILFGASAMFAQPGFPKTTLSQPETDMVAQECGVYTVDILATDYYNVGAISYTIDYPAGVITTPTIDSYASEVAGYSYFNPNAGTIKIGWNDNNQQNTIAFLPPNFVLFTLQFTVLAPNSPAFLSWQPGTGNLDIVNEIAGPGGLPVYPDDFTGITWTTNPVLGITLDGVDCFQCPQDPTGAIQITATGGNGTYWYSWNGPGITPPGINVEDPTGLVEGYFTVVVTDDHYCSVELEVYVPFCDIQGPFLPENVNETVGCRDEAINPVLIPGYPSYPPVGEDACGGDVNPTPESPEIIETPIPPNPYPNEEFVDCEGTIEYKYTYIDFAGNVNTWSYIYHIVKTPLADLLPPVVEETVDCPSMVCCVTSPDPDIYKDDCGNPMIPVSSNCPTTQIPCEGTVVWSYDYESCTGEEYTWTHTFHIVRPPLEELIADDNNTTVDCFVEVPQPLFDGYGYFTGWDIEPIDILVCGNPNPTNSEGLDPINDEPEVYVEGVLQTPGYYYNGWDDTFDCEGVIEYRWYYEDCALSTATWSWFYEVDMPEFELPVNPEDDEEVIACRDLALIQPELPASFADFCGNDLFVIDATHSLLPANNGPVYWELTINDCTMEEEHERTWIFTYHIFEEDFFMPPDEYIIVECADEIEAGLPPIVFDNCNVELDAVGPTVYGTIPVCEGIISYVWSYEDATLYNHNWTRTFEVVKTPFFVPVDETVYVQCPSDVPQDDILDLAPVLEDNCENPLYAYGYEQLDEIPDCGNGYWGQDVRFEFYYEDCAGNSDSWMLTYNVHDTEAPHFEAPLDKLVYMNDGCFATGVGLGAPLVKWDNCSNEIDVTVEGLTSYPIGFTTVIWTATDCAGNSTVDYQEIEVRENSIYGKMEYYNKDFPPYTVMNNVIVRLYDGYGGFLATTTTDVNGDYMFGGLCAGAYEVRVDEYEQINKAPGGVNSTDAAEVFVDAFNGNPIEIVSWKAGDTQVPYGLFTAGDAGRIMQHYVTDGDPLFSFDSYYWNFYWAGQVTISNVGAAYPVMTITFDDSNNGDLTYDIFAMCEGDYNGSFIPSALKSASESLSLEYGDYQQVDSNVAFELPLNAGMDMEVGAISLIMNFPADEVEITGVFLTNNPESPVMYNVSGNELRIGWYSSDAIWVNKGESLITLQLNNATSADGIEFSLASDPLNELADGDYDVISDATLVIDIPSTSALGFGQNNTFAENIEFSNYPNPFIGYTTLTYSIPADGEVVLEIYDIIGNKVKVAVDETQSAGNYTQKLDANTLQPGIYTAILKYKTNDKEVVRAIKMIRK